MSRRWHVVYLAVIVPLVVYVVQTTLARRTWNDHTRFQAALLYHTNNYGNVSWLGVPVWQSVLDLWTLQETIAEVKPALVIECGTYKGGSSYFFAHLFDLLNHGRVVTVDIEKQHDLSHPRVTYLIGDCASPEIVGQVRAIAADTGGPIFVVLDSDHSQAHVLREMEAYAPLVTPGSYLHVQDGVIDILPMLERDRPGPLRAIEAFLPNHPEFDVDHARTEKFLITQHPKGWLRRKPATAVAMRP
jgi:cephalosporin hydroxylase